MKQLQILIALILYTSFFSCFAQNDTVKDGEASAYNLNKPHREEWLRNTNNGMFIHFNIDAQLGIVISHSLVGASNDYTNRYFEELPKTFYPSHFNPKEIAVLAKLAGMKYIMFTTKHHAGFCFWDTKTTGFNIMNTPYAKDLLKEMVTATRNEGLQVGFYFSPEDFSFLYKKNIPISRDQVLMEPSVKKEFDNFTRAQCEELMTNYGKIDLLFIDGEPKETVKETAWKLQPDILITRGALKTPEQMLPGTLLSEPWLSCITIGTAWQYQPTNERYKSGTQLIELLIEARSKGGSLLLNIGPKPDGSMAPEQENILREMAAWYFINKESVDSTRPWVVTNEGNIWFTNSASKKNLYALVTGGNWKEGERKTFTLHSVKSSNNTKISVLGQNSLIQEYNPGKNVSCTFNQTDTGLIVSVVKAQRIYDDHKWPNPVVIKLENIVPAIQPFTVITVSSKTTTATQCLLTGNTSANTTMFSKAFFQYRLYHGQTENLYGEAWKQTQFVDIDKKGKFQAIISGLKPGQQYEYRAVAKIEKVSITGDKKTWKQ